MDRQDVFDVARVITELAMNAESAGARRFDLTLSQGKLTTEDDGRGMSEEQFSLAKRGLFTTKGEGRGKGLQLINRFCKLQMQRKGEITRITCTFTHLELGDIAGAAALAAAGEMTVRCEIFGRVTLLWAARGDAVKILENKKRIR